jgi:hypothetical protein
MKRKIAWDVLAQVFVNDIKLHIIRTLASLDRPMSPLELTASFDDADLANVAYHAGKLAELGVLTRVREVTVRGVVQKYYDLADAVLA